MLANKLINISIMNNRDFYKIVSTVEKLIPENEQIKREIQCMIKTMAYWAPEVRGTNDRRCWNEFCFILEQYMPTTDEAWVIKIRKLVNAEITIDDALKNE